MGAPGCLCCELCGRKLKSPKRGAPHNFCTDCHRHRPTEIRAIKRRDFLPGGARR
jgi:hypothetical protein